MRKFLTIAAIVLLSLAATAQQKTITGKVVSKATNEPLQGVSVQAKNKAVATDATGKFSLQTTVGETVTLSFVGMQPLTVKVTSATQDLNLACPKRSWSAISLALQGLIAAHVAAIKLT